MHILNKKFIVMKKFEFIIALMLFVCIGRGFAQNVVSRKEIDSIKAEIHVLKDYKENIDSYSKAAIQKIENQANDKIDDRLKELEAERYSLLGLIILGIPTTLIAGYQLIWGIRKKINTLIVDRIEKIIEKNREDILRVVETELFDNKLRNTKQLLVIGADEESNTALRNFLEKVKFKKVATRVSGRDQNLPEHDLIIFNTPNGELSEDVIQGFLQDADENDTYFVAYIHGRLAFSSNRLNFASSHITLYHNILSALKYMEIAKALEADAL